MTDIQFYHLEGKPPEQALPALVEKAFSQGLRVVVEAPGSGTLERLDERLWTFSDDSFLPHAIAGESADASQPILLTTQSDNANGAAMRFLLAGAGAAAVIAASPTPYESILILFDGSDEAELARARAQWTQLRDAGLAVSYWRQGDGEVWTRVR